MRETICSKSQFETSVASHRETSDKGLFTLASHVREEAFQNLWQFLCYSCIIVKTILGIGVPTVAGIGHDDDEIGSSKQAFYIGPLEPTIMITRHPRARGYKTGISLPLLVLPLD